jgi:hypothetical protein
MMDKEGAASPPARAARAGGLRRGGERVLCCQLREGAHREPSRRPELRTTQERRPHDAPPVVKRQVFNAAATRPQGSAPQRADEASAETDLEIAQAQPRSSVTGKRSINLVPRRGSAARRRRRRRWRRWRWAARRRGDQRTRQPRTQTDRHTCAAARARRLSCRAAAKFLLLLLLPPLLRPLPSWLWSGAHAKMIFRAQGPSSRGRGPGVAMESPELRNLPGP